ncbi:MAG: hypothetical protein M1817_006936 [Caeruleum heppii]|nr:MAG: hypothetical protein M1817_006936 [Caeruleum heppii]
MPGLIHLDYILENPSSHLLTWTLAMEASDDFAFSGPKLSSLQLVPLSRHTVRFNLWPSVQGTWIRPQLKVVDRYYNKTLKSPSTLHLDDHDHVHSPSARRTAFHFFAGLTSGLLSAVLLQPADLLKTRLQQHSGGATTLLRTIRDIRNGPQPIRAFWRGTAPSTIRTGVGSALYFSGLNRLRRAVEQAGQRGYLAVGAMKITEAGDGHSTDAPRISSSSSSLPKLSNLANLTTGAVARASVGFVMMPITVIKVRYESDLYAYRSIGAAGRDILRHEGLRGLFVGFGATAARDAPYAGLYVALYEAWKARLSGLVGAPDQSSRMSGAASVPINFVSGVLAAALATALTNPFDSIKTRLQLMPDRYTNMLQAASKMIREDGARSLLDGLGLRMARKAVSSALAWSVYEELVRRGDGWGVDQSVA